ncbi:ATP-binding protein [Anaeromyxobacter oryzae]|uniref:histidine kinase n=1 Tax=Anaeromyxobacter oryzae TaxID=2918170 RepID=A0ABM7WS65_9BACT|nr:ATP-binding protein [Anaeromyxobacter oryzae]BDG02324.1 two-component sensor histidine kinase [Anaeromyxobacter oryzae]
MTSIRRTLLVALLAAVAAVTLAAAFLVYRLARQEIDTIFDYHLRQIALTFRSQVAGRGAPAGDAGDGFDYAIQIWDIDGERLYLSRPDADLPENAELGFTTVRTPSGGDWRVYSTELSGLVVQVAQPLRVRQRLAFAAASRTLVPVLLMLPLLAMLVWRSVGRALAPLDRLAGAVASRTPSALALLPEAETPAEVMPLVRSLNELLARLGAALAAQRAFVADAAHELRTPLAALALQVQLAERARDPGERATALADVRAALDRTTHVVQQLLTLARAEPDAAPATVLEPVHLAELAVQAVADHARLAEARGVDLGATELAGDAVVAGDAAALRTLLANLVENALRYAPGARVDVSAGVGDGRPYLAVADRGPGIPAPERRRVFDRFYRRGGSAEPGSGLGLAIVKAIADRHGAAVVLQDAPGGGLTVRIDFPARAAVAAAPESDRAAPAPVPTTPDEDRRP